MPLEDAEAGITLVEDNLRRTLADCARFRTWAKASNQAQALARIYIDDLPEPPDDRDSYTSEEIIALRPFAIIQTAMRAGYSRGRLATGTYGEAGQLSIVFEENVDKSLARNTALLERRFKNHLGVIQTQMLELAYSATYLAIDLITFHGPMRCMKDDIPGEGDHHWAFFDVQHGIGQR
jgi:hypothetical protein